MICLIVGCPSQGPSDEPALHARFLGKDFVFATGHAPTCLVGGTYSVHLVLETPPEEPGEVDTLTVVIGLCNDVTVGTEHFGYGQTEQCSNHLALQHRDEAGLDWVYPAEWGKVVFDSVSDTEISGVIDTHYSIDKFQSAPAGRFSVPKVPGGPCPPGEIHFSEGTDATFDGGISP